jgi:hypothetical protein
MNWLKQFGITSDTIKELYKRYEPGVIENALLDQEKLIDVIMFLQENGLKSLEGVLLNNLTFLFFGKKKIEAMMEKDSSVKEAIQKINEDVKYINKLMK